MHARTITVNGAPQPWREGLTAGELVVSLGLNPEAVAVEHNGVIVPCEAMETTPLAAGDVLEIIHFVGGG